MNLKTSVEFYLVDVLGIYDDVAEQLVDAHANLLRKEDTVPNIASSIIAAECERLGTTVLPKAYFFNAPSESDT